MLKRERKQYSNSLLDSFFIASKQHYPKFSNTEFSTFCFEMDSKLKQARFTWGKQSSLNPERDCVHDDDEVECVGIIDDDDSRVRIMYLANEGDADGINELLDSGVDVNFRDADGRTALHVAACQSFTHVVELLLRRGADVTAHDRWGSTPLADAIYYKNHDTVKLLEKHGARPPIAPMHVQNVREVPEYEIDPSELDFSNSVDITKGTYQIALWRGIEVAVKKLDDELIADEYKVNAFRDELTLLQKVRHPNVVQFLGAVTQSSPMMIITEYLPKGDLREFLQRKGTLRPSTAIKFALDIARGMNYLHEHKPEAIIHRDLEPSNILLDDSGHLKVADFGASKLLKFSNTIREDRFEISRETSWRYVAPEVFKNEEYGTKVDVFSFALILQEMLEGCPPFVSKQGNEVPKAYVANERPPFNVVEKLYGHRLRELIEECWCGDPSKRPTFRQIITNLESIKNQLSHKRHWKVGALLCFKNIWKRDKTTPASRSSRYK